MANSIFKGPQYYKEEDKDNFRGRKNEADTLFYLVSNNDFSVCYAESGEGKSSLINAGLCPKLRENGMFPVQIRFDEFDTDIDFDAFVWNELNREIQGARKETGKFVIDYESLEVYKNSLEDVDGSISKKLWWKLGNYELRLNSYETLTPVLIFDQFEEVFTRPQDIGWTLKFFEWFEDIYNHRDLIKDLSLESTRNNFKVLLSLRSEYVCELDYWSMSQCFIPSLKNNRYFLKPLTKKAADEVLGIGEGIIDNINKEEFFESVKAKRVEHLPNKEIDKDRIPCISALLLSLILSELERKDEKLLALIKDTNSDEKIFNKVLEYIYEKALKESNFDESSEKVLEEVLIDGFGNRKKVGEKDLASIPQDSLKKLEANRIINKVADYYEISHDSICNIMNEKRMERIKIGIKEAEEARALAETKAKRFKDNVMISVLFLIIFLSYVYLYFYVFPYYYSVLENNNIRFVVKNVSKFMPVVLASVVVLFVKKLNPLKRTDIIEFCKSNILLAFLIIYATFQFVCDSIYSINIESVHITPKPGSSGWGLLVIPLLVLELLRRYSKMNHKIFKSKKWIVVFGVLVLFVFVFNSCNYLPIGSLPSLKIFYYLLFGLFALYFFLVKSFFAELIPLKVWGYATLCTFVLMVVFQINLGFCLSEIDCRNVKKINSWEAVFVQNADGKYGILSWNGDTILPCAFDISNKKMVIHSKQSFKLMPELQDTADSLYYYGRLKFNKSDKGVVCVNYDYHPWTEIWMMNKHKVLKDRIKKDSIVKKCTAPNDVNIEFYAIDSYLLLRKNNIRFLSSGKDYSVSDLHSLRMLDSLQMKKTENFLDTLHVASMTDEQFCELNRNIARTLLTGIIMDVIEKKDTIRKLCYPLDLLLTFFPDCLRYNKYNLSSRSIEEYYQTINMNCSINISFGTMMTDSVSYNDSFIISVSSEDLRKGQSYAWANWANYFALRDASKYAPISNDNLNREFGLIQDLMKYAGVRPLEKGIIKEKMDQITDIQKTREGWKSFNSLIEKYFDSIIVNTDLKHCLYASSLFDLFNNLLMMGSGRQFDMLNYVIKSREVRIDLYNNKFNELEKWNIRLKKKNDLWKDCEKEMRQIMELSDLFDNFQNKTEKSIKK